MPPPRPARLYGVVDCARDEALYPHVAAQGGTCLFEGRLHADLVRVSPHLVELGADDELSRLWRAEGWGQAWGLLVTSGAQPAQVRRRLRHFTQARLPDGQGPVLFRFWDPRVFRVFMPHVEPDALADWFADIDAYTVESEDGQGSIRFSLTGGRLSAEAGRGP